MADYPQSLPFTWSRIFPWSAVVLLMCWHVPASAAEPAVSTDAMLEFVGLTAQIERSAATIIDETTGTRNACNDQAPFMQELAGFIAKLYAADALRLSARESLESKLTVAEKSELNSWMNSPLGQKIYAAEAATEDQDLDTMRNREKALVNSPGWTQERQKRIYRVLRVTRVHDYVAALNAALTTVVKMASACQLDSQSLDEVEMAIRRDRADEKLIGRMMLPGFVVPTGVVFAALTDEELHEYFLFSSTPTAQKWYGIVIDTVRSMLLERVPSLRQYLQRD